MKNKFLISCVLVCICLLALGVPRASAYTYDGMSFEIDNGKITIIASVTSAKESLVIPEEIDGYPVTRIADNAFDRCYSLKSITIPNSITHIGNAAFYRCTGLTNVEIPGSVAYIGNLAFSECSNLTSVTMADGITQIGTNAFYNCKKLARITIPNSVTSIGGAAFYGTAYYNDYANWANNVLYIGNHLIEGRTALAGVYTVKYGTITIADCAFNNCTELSSVTIPSTVVGIGERAFYNTAYYNNSANWTDDVLYIDSCLIEAKSTLTGTYTTKSYARIIADNAFGDCHSLKSINLAAAMTSIGDYAFYKCSGLTDITIPNSVTSIGCCAFGQCIGLTDITIPNRLTRIDPYTFSGCSDLTNVTIPSSVTDIGYRAFSDCNTLSAVHYSGTADMWNEINIEPDNSPLQNAPKMYSVYVNLLDRDGNQISFKKQNTNEIVDISGIFVPNGYILKLYKDKAMTEEYLLDTPIQNNLTLYVELIEMNSLKLFGAEKADIAQKGVTQTVCFVTDKDAKYFGCTVKFSKDLTLSSVKAMDFNVEEDFRETKDGYTYLYLTCIYKTSESIPLCTKIFPFELVFDVSTSARVNDVLTVEILDDAVLSSGNTNASFVRITNAQITVNPILVQSILINGIEDVTIDGTSTVYTASVLPENATTKTVEWSVDDDTVATVSSHGSLLPKKSGIVTLKATATDGSGVYAQKTIHIMEYAMLASLSVNTGTWNTEFSPELREYIIYVPKSATSIKLAASHNGVLTANNKDMLSGISKTFPLPNDEVTMTLHYTCNGYASSVYSVKFIKFEGTKTSVSENRKTFHVKPINVSADSTIILALYDGDNFVEMQAKPYGTDVTLTTAKGYTTAKVMVWENLGNIRPVCGAEIVK